MRRELRRTLRSWGEMLFASGTLGGASVGFLCLSGETGLVAEDKGDTLLDL